MAEEETKSKEQTMIENVLGLFNLIVESKPVVKIALDTLYLYKDEIKRIPEDINAWMVKEKIKTFNTFVYNGLTRKEALLLTMDNAQSLQNIVESTGIKNSIGKKPKGVKLN